MVKSLLDVDLYKLTMMQLAWKKHPDLWVKYEFRNRSSGVKLADFINPYGLSVRLQNCQSLTFSYEDVDYLRSTGLFADDFLNWLTTFQLPGISVRKTDDGQLAIETEGIWPRAILWETIILSTVNEMYNEEVSRRSGIHEVKVISDGLSRLKSKVERLERLGAPVKFTDFGTRRRYSHLWQGLALDTLKKTCPQLDGTSNVYWARELGLKPVGTYAHELDMVYCGMKPVYTWEDMKAAHLRMMDDWFALYGPDLSIALTDTYGADFFFETVGDRLRTWKGLRHDSGNPFVWACQAAQAYTDAGIDMKDKTLVFSDGLDVDTIIDIDASFYGEINLRYGWGTDLMNDMGNRPLSIVVKATEANGNGLVKLSDNLSKAIGPYPEEIARVARLVSYKRREPVPA